MNRRCEIPAQLQSHRCWHFYPVRRTNSLTATRIDQRAAPADLKSAQSSFESRCGTNRSPVRAAGDANLWPLDRRLHVFIDEAMKTCSAGCNANLLRFPGMILIVRAFDFCSEAIPAARSMQRRSARSGGKRHWASPFGFKKRRVPHHLAAIALPITPFRRRGLAAHREPKHQPVDDFALIHRVLVAAPFGQRNQRCDQRPFFVRHIAGVAQFAPVIPTTVFVDPRLPAPANQVAAWNRKRFQQRNMFSDGHEDPAGLTSYAHATT